MLKIVLAAAALLALPLTAHAQEPIFKASKIVLVGDSTVAVNSGWGGAFCATHVTSNIACVNLGRGGRSSRTYREEGSWALALKEMSTGGFEQTFVLIQLGHNDQPGRPERSTDLATEFPANLRRFVEEARAAGARPVLVTPLIRRQFKDGQVYDDLAPWAQAIRKLAAETNTPLVDLHALSRDAVQAMGPVAAMRLAEIPPPPEVAASAASGTTTGAMFYEPVLPGAVAPPRPPAAPPSPPGAMGSFKPAFDYTHLGPEGAALFSAMVAKALADVAPTLRRNLLP
ncbi:rhamnogalacturonan acetylesterase [Caulobacter vibrioides]|uniref:rhamnogalacturonan acetylesterase n=1 Tax=Caulobacter vibrioides TaxID=155892 RepID=UPI000BB5179D|nr:rhamnogalacturonan acetylesterase [Caulobacter vibrioides]ATC23783.1 lysophospholipase [Caulobacter vibrioides]AZH12024.1 rhamnogalacturonan acetylesterase [Caulobacter vibrioides]PLR16008.1 lysophospholipase [Caulobacter vibrioides]